MFLILYHNSEHYEYPFTFQHVEDLLELSSDAMKYVVMRKD